LKTETLTAVS